MHSAPRDSETDARFIEAGGLKSWGCPAFLLAILVLGLLFAIVRTLLLNLVQEPGASWVTVLLLMAVVTTAIFFWIRRRRRLQMAQKDRWQTVMGSQQQGKKAP